MTHLPDYRVQDLLRLRPALRGDLIFTPCEGATPYYLVEDPVRGKFFRMGRTEYTFISLLDGRTLEEVLRQAIAILGVEALTEAEAAAIIRWLHDAELIESRGIVGAPRSLTEDTTKRFWARCNPLVARIPLIHPQDWFARLVPVLGWVFSSWLFACWSLTVGAALIRLLAQHERLLASGREIFFLDRALCLAACWLVLKVIHETAHGLACARYGGSVRQAGVIVVLCMPMAYVDVTSSWRFRSAWQRIVVAAAGMYVELFVAALAALVWSATAPGILNDLCFNLLLVAGVSTLLMNANPLMRFDGYYILSDLLGVPNLASVSRQAAGDLVRRWLIGGQSRNISFPRRQRNLLVCYGLAAWLWSLVVTAGMLIGAALLFHGAGIVLAAAGVVVWWAVPVSRACASFSRSGSFSAMKTWHGMARLTIVLVLVAAGLMLVPAAWSQRVPALVEYAPLTIVRARATGIVRKVLVKTGQRVEQGQLIIVIENEQLQQELRDLDLAIEQSELQIRALLNQQKHAAAQAESAQHQTLMEQRAEKRGEVAHLEVIAPRAGEVLTPHPEQLLETYAVQGQELLAIGDEDHKELVLSIDQEDLEAFQSSLSLTVSTRLNGAGRQLGILYRVAPAASTEPTHEAFCATAGGPIPVRVPTGTDDDRRIFVRPRFEAAVRLTAEQSRQLRAGQRGVVWPATRPPSLASSMYRAFRGWWRERNQD